MLLRCHIWVMATEVFIWWKAECFLSFPFSLAQNQQGVAIHEIILSCITYPHVWASKIYWYMIDRTYTRIKILTLQTIVKNIIIRQLFLYYDKMNIQTLNQSTENSNIDWDKLCTTFDDVSPLFISLHYE